MARERRREQQLEAPQQAVKKRVRKQPDEHALSCSPERVQAQCTPQDAPPANQASNAPSVLAQDCMNRSLAKRTRCRAVKTRPENVEQLTTDLETGKLDNRTASARRLVQARESLAKEPHAVCRGLVLDSLAASATIMSELLVEIAKPGAVLQDGELNPLISKNFFEVQKSMLRSIAALQQLDGKRPAIEPDKEPFDVSSLVLAANRG